MERGKRKRLSKKEITGSRITAKLTAMKKGRITVPSCLEKKANNTAITTNIITRLGVSSSRRKLIQPPPWLLVYYVLGSFAIR
jgi:hypothetical protein